MNISSSFSFFFVVIMWKFLNHCIIYCSHSDVYRFPAYIFLKRLYANALRECASMMMMMMMSRKWAQRHRKIAAHPISMLPLSIHYTMQLYTHTIYIYIMNSLFCADRFMRRICTNTSSSRLLDRNAAFSHTQHTHGKHLI